METGPSDRLEGLCSVFLSSRLEVHRETLRRGLNREERAAYENRLCEWWYRFAKRTGNLQRSPETMREDLLFCASVYAADFKEWLRSEPELQIDDELDDVSKHRRGLKLVKPETGPESQSRKSDGDEAGT